MKVTKYTIREFNTDFATDADCLQYLFDQQYPNGGTCEKCSKTKCFYPVTGRKCYACSWCGFQVSPTAGTIFHKSSTSLRSWFHAMFLMTASRNGVSAMELMRQVGVTYKTAWRMNHQIRQLMNEKPALFGGTVEADECYIGGVRKGGKGRKVKTTKVGVMGVLERGGNIAVKTIPNLKTDTLIKNVAKTTRRGATVMTDEHQSYKQLPTIGFNHNQHPTLNIQ